MAYYVYKITNKINGKWYIGKRKHRLPFNDPYMGSGKLIKVAIEKYGKDNFTKEILDIFETNEEASRLESYLVTKQSIKSNMSYNMHEGGHGGFAHLNDGSQVHKERCKKASLLVKNRYDISKHCGENKFSSESSLKANEIKKKKMKENSEKYIEIYKNISDFQKNNNSMKDKCWCVPKDSINYNNDKKVFLKNSIPAGWISLIELRDIKKRKSGVYGKFWIHNPTTRENKYHSGDVPLGWYKGRKNEYYQQMSVDNY